MSTRVVVTGLGVVAPNGVGKEAFWQALITGLSGVHSIRRFDASCFSSRIAGEVDTLNPLDYFEPKELKKVDRSNVYAVAAAQMALADSGLNLDREDRERVGSAIGNSLGGVDFVDKEIDVMRQRGPHWGSPYLAIAFFSCGTNGLLSIRLGLKGVVLTFCNGNTSGSDAIGMAYRTIQSGRADVMFAGGTEAPIVPLFLGSLAKDGMLSQKNDAPTQASRPFDQAADGMVLSEGAGLLVLESRDHAQARGAHIYGEIAGYASGSSAFDLLRPETNGHGLVNTMRRALKEAHLTPRDVDTVHGQGFSLRDYDDMEARCIRDVFHPTADPLITAISSSTGNAMGGMGGWQAVASALMLDRQARPPVANLTQPANTYPLNLVQTPRQPRAVDHLVQNAFCFLGKSSTLVMRRFHS